MFKAFGVRVQRGSVRDPDRPPQYREAPHPIAVALRATHWAYHYSCDEVRDAQGLRVTFGLCVLQMVAGRLMPWVFVDEFDPRPRSVGGIDSRPRAVRTPEGLERYRERCIDEALAHGKIVAAYAKAHRKKDVGYLPVWKNAEIDRVQIDAAAIGIIVPLR